MRKVLSIAGSDPGGGAGIQADIKTISALGCFAMTAITAITVQNTVGVRRVFPLPVDLIEEQIRAVLEDIDADAVKIGMLFDTPSILAVEKSLLHFKGKIVLDPVMVAKGGGQLMQTQAKRAIIALFPKVFLITPNTDEASALLEYEVDDLKKAAAQLIFLGARNVLLKGGHLKKSDILMTEEGVCHELPIDWINTIHTHGTGCTYASAIAAFLALGNHLVDATLKAKAYLQGAISTSLHLGSGRGPIHHFWRAPCAS